MTKADDEHIEERGTMDPILVTDFLVSVLSAMGKPTNSGGIWKNTRDEVLWKFALLPWRRSPVWLLARVTLQLVFSRLADYHIVYKHFMVFLMGEILSVAHSKHLSSDILHCMMAKISKRLLKLNGDLEYRWFRVVENHISSVKLFMDQA